MKENTVLAIIAVALLATGAAAFTYHGLSSTGEVEIIRPNNSTSEEEAVTFSDGSRERTASFEGQQVYPGETITDEFTLVNNRESETDLRLDATTAGEVESATIYVDGERVGNGDARFDISNSVNIRIDYTISENVEEWGSERMGVTVGYDES